jgi:hypothetical protein
MGFTNAAKNAAVDGIAAAATYLSLHTADPGTTGASEVTGGTYARVATSWSASSAGSKPGSATTLNVPASTTIGWWGLWTAASGGTFHYGGTIPASEAYGSAGTYVLTPTLTAS